MFQCVTVLFAHMCVAILSSFCLSLWIRCRVTCQVDIYNKPDCVVTGLGFVVETVVGKGELYLCELCNMRSNLNNMVDHIIGIKHRLAYLVSRLCFSCNSLYEFLACISIDLCFSCNS